jgi:hypothetical protein
MTMWEVEVTDEFAYWYSSLDEKEHDELIARVDLLGAHGPGLGTTSTCRSPTTSTTFTSLSYATKD